MRLVLLADEGASAEARAAAERARERGAAVRPASRASLWRLSALAPPAELLALVGPDPGADADAVLAGEGAVWLLVGITYPGNTGFAIRTAEVTGAAGVFAESALLHEGRREAVRAAMRADRFMPLFWEEALPVIERARAHGRTVLAVEDVGERAPWEADLAGRPLLVLGGERHGIPQEVLAACDAALRIPMAGFIPSYNLQAAMAIVAGERLRQLQRAGETS